MRTGTALRALAWAALLLVLSSPAAEGACSISATGVSFGTYDVLAATPTDSTGGVNYQCDPKEKDIRITLSTGSSGTFGPRSLVNGSHQLAYNLFEDAALTRVWGDGSGGTVFHVKKTPHPVKPTTIPIYGRIPALQDVAVGTYADTIIVTIDF